MTLLDGSDYIFHRQSADARDLGRGVLLFDRFKKAYFLDRPRGDFLAPCRGESDANKFGRRGFQSDPRGRAAGFALGDNAPRTPLGGDLDLVAARKTAATAGEETAG